MKLFLPDEAATIAFAGQFVSALPADLSGLTVLLEGELGAGKSTFARGLIRSLGHEGAVPSPTYTLVEPYQLTRGTVYHVDLYRVGDAEELRFLGWNELDSGLRLVEWPDRAPQLADDADVRLTFSYDGDGRRVHVDGLSLRGQEIVAGLALPIA
jgi:tRNA threonylcarbamoyladenosine biosynthesis protein TsaE